MLQCGHLGKCSKRSFQYFGILFSAWLALFSSLPLFAQQRSFQLPASARVQGILTAANISERRDFEFGRYQNDFRFRAPNGLTLPRTGPALAAAGHTFYRAVFADNNGRNPQIDLPRVVRAILGDTTAVIGAWAYSDLVNISTNPDAEFFRGCNSQGQCRNVNTVSNKTYQQEELEEGRIDTVALREAIRRDRTQNGDRPLSQEEAHQLAQRVMSAAFFGQRNQGEEFVSNRHFRYQHSSYRDWSKLDVFVGLHPEIVWNYGNYVAVMSDRRGRTIDLNAYNHNYYQNPSIRACGDNQCTRGGSDYYSMVSVDNGEFIYPGVIRSEEIEGIDLRGSRTEGTNRRGTPEIEVAYRRIRLSDNRSAVLVIDPRGGDGFIHTCVRLNAQQVPVGCSRTHAAQNAGIRAEDPMQVAYARVPENVGEALPIVGLYMTCPAGAAVNTSRCSVPSQVLARYRVRSLSTSLATQRDVQEQQRLAANNASLTDLRVNGQVVRFFPLSVNAPTLSTSTSSTSSSGGSADSSN